MILNLMLGKKRGGLEQAALDYAEVLALAKIPALTVLSPTAWLEAPLVAANLPHEPLPNVGGWDPLAARRLRRLAARAGARAILCHGNRALKLALRACKGKLSIIAVAHNYATARFTQADHGFAVTPHLARHLASQGMAGVTCIPNMVRPPSSTRRGPYRDPPVIGAFGRIMPKKGFDLLVEALALLATRGVPFRAMIGGDGPQLVTLTAQIAAHGLQNHIRLCGWVQDRTAFFEAIDLFVLPSRQEAFGIALIEAMAYGVPVVTTDAHGPAAIVHPNEDALLVPRENPQALADAIAALLSDFPRAQSLAHAAQALVTREYTPEAMAVRLQQALAPYIGPRHG